ncbi:hypothetical protein [Pedobacter zeae]|uniref:Uncharacterized protein n=1 Tax=Pedobacter zeae TaxID=1737356 RepID=A0A7W6K755_9SPHI|nr:hypothetical protein [Pedobacter zeae]MBB4106436.1 hypothetical protein [Pedobacter zeae]GGH01701.1 hypothetical protein GCM10007422_15630 [Pedobacter zeae]
MQNLSNKLQIDLIELKAKYAFIMDELEVTFADAYLSKVQTKQRLAEQMMKEIERILSGEA